MGAMNRFFTKDLYKNLFLFSWLVLGLFQAGFTELMDDEAYYWVYSRHLDWGYFDHPPMIALLIKMGYAIFPGALGVRFFIVIINTLTLWITARLLDKQDNLLFYIIIGCMGAMQVGGMLAVPDVPLIFFGALYFLLYRSFLESQSWRNTLLLGLSMALMFYSKYHGVLLVFFTVVSNLNLLRVFKFYMACIITTALFLPHLYWQYTHGFPSLQYHLVERNASAYDINFTLEYLLGQLLLFGPLAGWLILYYGIRCPVQHAFERALKFSLIGVLVFFMISTFKGRVEANWTVMLFTPVVILAHQTMIRKDWNRKWLWYLLWPTLFIVLIVRIYLVWDFLPGTDIRPEIHHNKTWTGSIAAKAGDRPVVFINSYQAPSKYMFYTGHLSYSLNSRFARRSQYNYWNTEEELWGKEVMVASSPEEGLPAQDSVRSMEGNWNLTLVPKYYSYNLIQLKPALTHIQAYPGERVNIVLQPYNGYRRPIPIDRDDEPVLGYSFSNKERGFEVVKTPVTLERAMLRRLISVEVEMPQTPGHYQLKFSVCAGILPPTHNSVAVEVSVRRRSDK